MRRFFIGGTPELEDIRYVGNTDTQAALAVLLTLTYFRYLDILIDVRK